MRRFLEGLTLGRAVGLVVAGMGALAMSGRLIDPSFLTHLATGRIILDSGFPREDPYTFTAAGEPWVVQSWLAGVGYAGLERWFGLGAIRVLVAVVGGLVAAGTWALSRPAGTLTGRLVLVLPLLGVAFNGWSERPLIFGLLGLVVVLLAAEAVLDPRWLLPASYLWANTHGSWPLGLGLLVLLAIGRRLDGGRPRHELRALRWMAAGLALSLLNPYGWRLLMFPIDLLERREALSHIVEWRPPRYDRPAEQLFLVLVAVAAVAFVRRRNWRSVLPSAVFVLLAVTGARNVLPAAIVLVAAVAPSLAGWGSIGADVRGRPAQLAAAVAASVFATAAVLVASTDDLNTEIYPVAAERWLEANDLSPAQHRVVAREAVGNWFEFRYGPTQRVFVDDRIEVLPLQVVEDHTDLLEGVDDWEAILARYEPDAVVWEVDQPLADLLEGDDDWEITHRDDRYLVAVPAGS